MRRFLQWIVRRALLYAVLVLAFAAAGFIAQAWNQASEHRAVFQDLDDVEKELRSGRDEWKQEFEESTAALETRTTEDLDRRIADTRQQIKEEQAQLDAGKRVRELLRRGSRGLVENQKRKLRIALLGRQLETLEAARDLVDRRNAEPRQRARLAEAQRRCDETTAELAALDSQWRYRWRSLIESRQHKELETARDEACGERDEARKQLNTIVSTQGRVRQAEEKYDASKDGLDRSFNSALSDLSSERAKAQTRWNGTVGQKLRLWAEARYVDSLLWKAFLTLIFIVATPYLIRLLFWFVFAPLAERRPAIRLRVPGGRGAAIPPAERSTTAVSIRLTTDEELLVRQRYLQTTSHGGAKATRWLLDWRHPLASIVSGLTFLTRIRGAGEMTTVSAVADPFAEVTVLTLPVGGSCVLQPRALTAVVQPIGRPLRVASHWRLRSLNAWLTLQLRYLVFHGPCRLVIKGGRGVRVERAERGRVFGQAQLIGFSADLSYSVTRAETFWPYFLGYEQLFKDKVEAGEGVLMIEEAPMAGRKNAGARRGLEDAFEVMTKALGI